MVKRVSNETLVSNMANTFSQKIADAIAKAAAARGIQPSSPLTPDDLLAIGQTQAGFRDTFEKMAEITNVDGPVPAYAIAGYVARALSSQILGWDTNSDGAVDFEEAQSAPDVVTKLTAMAFVDALGHEPSTASIVVEPSRSGAQTLGETLISKGLSSEFDIAGSALSPQRRGSVEAKRDFEPRDPRGEGLFRNALANADLNPHQLNIVFAGAAHVPTINYNAAKAGYLPLITGFFDVANQKSVLTTNMTSAYIQDALEMVLSNAVARRAPILVKPDAPAWLSIADEHMGDYSFVVPTADELKAADVRQVVLSLENYREGEVGLEVLANGPPVPRALAQIVEAYRAAGISVQVKGLESQDLRPERPFAELDRPSPGHLAHSPTFVAIAREAWLPPADYGSLTRQQALAFLARERESYLSRGPSWQAQVARVDQAIAEVTAEQTGD